MKKTLLITGASGDIGRAIVKSLCHEYEVAYLHYNKNVTAVSQLRDEILKETNTTEVHLINADFTKVEGVEQLVNQLQDPIHTIVHNSGTSHFGLTTDWNDDEAKAFIQLHVTSPFLLTKALLPNMVANKCGKIIVISSIWGITGASCEVLYSMVKGGQNSFVKALAKEVATSGISVNAVAPGAISTKMLDGFSDSDLAALKEEIPEGRLGTPEEVANVVSFLSSEKSSYINGQIISVNGAWHC